MDNNDASDCLNISNQGPTLNQITSHEMEDFSLNPIGEREGDNPQYLKVIRQKFCNQCRNQLIY